jgi:hypothetical protein
MSGFLAGLVQRGASVPARAAESPGLAAPAADGNSAYALEAPPELVDARPASPVAMPREDSARTPQMTPTPRDEVPANPSQSVVHITQVNAVSPMPAHEPVQVAAVSAETPKPPLVMPPVPRAESVRIPEQSEARTPQPPRQTEPPAEPRLETSALVPAPRPIAAPPVADFSHVSNEPRVELEVMRVSAPCSAPLDLASSPAPAPKLPEVPVTATSLAIRELPRSAQPTPTPTPPPVPPIHVRIGRVEVRPAPPAPAPSAHKNANATPALGFAAYRRLRTYRM